MTADDRKNSKVIYCAIAFYIVLTISFNGRLTYLLNEIDDPVGKFLFVLLYLGFLPGALVSLYFLIRYAWRLLYICSSPFVAIFIWDGMREISQVGGILGLLIGIGWIYSSVVFGRDHPQTTRVTKEVVKFHKWLFGLPRRLFGGGRTEAGIKGEVLQLNRTPTTEETVTDFDKTDKYKASLDKLTNEYPEVQGISISHGYDNWYSGILQRIGDRDRQKTFAEKIKLLGFTKELYKEYRATLDAQYEVKVAPDVYAGKDEELSIAALERKKRKLALLKEIAELEKEPSVEERREEPTKPADSRTAEQRKSDALRCKRAERKDALAKCKGDPDCVKNTNVIYDDAEMRILEGR